MIQYFTKKHRGFTLIELLVVIAVIGLLASIVLVSLGPARQKARDAKRQSDLRQVNLAMEMSYDDSSADCGGLDKYITSASVPTKICPTGGQYLNPFPSNVAPYDYTWVPNTAACTPTGLTAIPIGQWYCAYVQLEAESAWFVASQKGTKKVTTVPPANCNCGVQ
jgi:prepilin-type N-terminal cleavage/methylation domain-containing protein